MKLYNKAEHMKVIITQEDTLQANCTFIIKYYQLLLLFGFIAMQASGVTQHVKVDPLWPSKIFNGLVNAQNCLVKPRSPG